MCAWGGLDQKWGGARIGSISKLSRARNSLGEKYLYVSEEQFVGPPRHHSGTQSRRLAKPFTASPPAQGASSSTRVRKNVETMERAFVVLLYLGVPMAIG